MTLIAFFLWANSQLEEKISAFKIGLVVELFTLICWGLCKTFIGRVVAGIIGLKKFAYDLWGDTVNIASRMESHGIAGTIQVCETTYQLLKDKYLLEKRGLIKVIVTKMDGAIAEANDAFLGMVGYSQEDLRSGQVRWREMIPPEYIEANNSAIPSLRDAARTVSFSTRRFSSRGFANANANAELTTQGVCQPFENEYIRKDHSRVAILLSSALLENNSNDIISFVVDLSKRKQLELALSKSEERYRTFLEQSSEAIWCIELEVPISPDCPEYEQIQHFYKYVYLAECNNVMAQMYGFSCAEEIISARLGDFLVSSDPDNIAHLRSFIRSNYRLIDAESHEIDKQGNSKYFLNNLVGIVENGLLVRAWGTQRDITERKQAEQEREQLLEREQSARADAETANRIKDDFLATLSHELRTPLNAIMGWTQLLRSRKLNEPTTFRALETIERNSKSLTQLIEDILDVSRIIRGTLHLNIHQVKLVPLVEAAIDTVRPAAQAKEISFNLSGRWIFTIARRTINNASLAVLPMRASAGTSTV